MTEHLLDENIEYQLIGRAWVREACVELWGALRDVGLIRYRAGHSDLRIGAELLGWSKVPKLYWFILLRDDVDWTSPHGHEEQIRSVAADIHTALCLLGKAHVVSLQQPCFPLNESERSMVLRDFGKWMEAHGFTVQISKGDIKIKRTRSRLFMRTLRFEERVELGRWVGHAYEALRSDNSENCVLYISEHARYGDNTRSISW